ncbi:MAG: hypothetical protein JSV51_02090 [Candidatus Bathyarchaeota archaeon]|nr:MAG: hypothetical protein JSV51_02090 [Candidatus Bathyarchaeota archaeon]
MSSDESAGFLIADKFFGLLIILIGSIVIYSTSTSPDLEYPSLLFAIGGLSIISLGFFMILAKVQ